MRGYHRFFDHMEASAGAEPTPPTPLDPAQESLSQALRAGFNVLRVIIVVLLVAYFLSGWFQVNPGEQGIIVRLGKLRINRAEGTEYTGTPIFGEGWHASLPDPFDEKIRISGQNYKERIYTFCFPLEAEDMRKDLGDINLGESVPAREKLKPGADGTMLTGDRNLSHGLWAIEYRIEDAAQFVENIGETREVFERLLRRLAENAIVRTVAGMQVERVVRTQTDELVGDFTLEVKRRLSQELDALETGVIIINVEAKTIEPGRVRDAFLAVTKAKSQRKEKEQEARQEANKILSRAAGPRERKDDATGGTYGYEALIDAIEAYGAAQALNGDDAELESHRSRIDHQLERAEGEVAVRLRQAQSRANAVRERVQQEYALFADQRDTYRKYPELTLVWLWVQMRDAVLSSAANEIFFVPNAGEIEIITNRDLQRQVETDIQRYQRRYEPKP